MKRAYPTQFFDADVEKFEAVNTDCGHGKTDSNVMDVETITSYPLGSRSADMNDNIADLSDVEN